MNASQTVKQSFSRSISSIKSQKGLLYLIVFFIALVAFEAFNFGTTEYALTDLLGDLRFLGLRWATLLSIAFCAIDFTGIAKLFAPQHSKTETSSGWYLFGAWILAATMNAILTWWGIVMAMQSHLVVSTAVVSESFVSKTVPIFIALMVWVIRILLIGSLSRKGDRLLHETEDQEPEGMSRREFRQTSTRNVINQRSVPAGLSRAAVAGQSVQKQRPNRPEATYIPVQQEQAFRSMKAAGAPKHRI